MQAGRALTAAAALVLASCQSGPPAPVITLAEASQSEPISVAASVSANTSEGMTENDWGGEVPQSKPAGDVNEGDLGDLD